MRENSSAFTQGGLDARKFVRLYTRGLDARNFVHLYTRGLVRFLFTAIPTINAAYVRANLN